VRFCHDRASDAAIRVFVCGRALDRVVRDVSAAPSYFIEGMLYNVPAHRFAGNEQMKTKDVLDWLLAEKRHNFVCANEQFKLRWQWQCDLAR
jgi:hypothetical protein